MLLGNPLQGTGLNKAVHLHSALLSHFVVFKVEHVVQVFAALGPSTKKARGNLTFLAHRGVWRPLILTGRKQIICFSLPLQQVMELTGHRERKTGGAIQRDGEVSTPLRTRKLQERVCILKHNLPHAHLRLPLRP